MHTYALEPYHNIIINDLDDIGLELLEYRGDEHMYLLYDIDVNEYTSILRASDDYRICYLDKNDKDSTILLKDLVYLQNIDQVEDISTEFYLDIDESSKYKATKVEYGMTVGYRLTELTYAGTLISSIGEAITSVLDKIKNMLGEFEYFYDLDGRFVFQRKKNYINSIFNNIQQDGDDMWVENSAYSDQFIYRFEGGNLISSYQNSPNLTNLKNDFSVWGNRKSLSGADIPIHYRYAIDDKPKYYKAYDGTVYYASMEDALEDYEDENAVLQAEEEKKISINDWRELIYQMALDYYKNNQKDDFLFKIEENNKKPNELISRYPNGTTGYERYYIDIQGFWRQLYNPYPSTVYISSPSITIENELYHFTNKSNNLFTHFKYRLYDAEKDTDKTNIKVLWGSNEGYREVVNSTEANYKEYYIYGNDCYTEDSSGTYKEEYFQIPENSWNEYTWDATNLEIFKNHYYVAVYEQVANTNVNSSNFNNYYIKEPDKYEPVGVNDYYMKEKTYYTMEYSKLEETSQEAFRQRKVNWYIKNGDQYINATSYKSTNIYYKLVYSPIKTDDVVINFAENKLNYFTKLPDSYIKIETFDSKQTYYALKYVSPTSYNVNNTYYYKTYTSIEEGQNVGKKYKLESDLSKLIKITDINLPFNANYFKYYRKNTLQLQSLIDTIKVEYDFTEDNKTSNEYYVAAAVTPQNPSGFVALTEDNARHVSKHELYKIDHSVDDLAQEKYAQVTSKDAYIEGTIYYQRNGYSEIIFTNKDEFDPRTGEYFIDVDGEKKQVSTNAIYDPKKTYYIVTYDDGSTVEKDDFEKNPSLYYTKQIIYTYRTLLELATKSENDIWIVDETDYSQYFPFIYTEGQDEQKDIVYAEWLQSIPALQSIFISADADNNIHIKNSITTNTLGLDGEIDETVAAVTSYLDFYEESYDYFIDGENKAWNRNVIEAPDVLNFWMDFLDTEGELKQYSINAVGDRPKVVNDNTVKSIYFRQVPEIIFIDSESLLDEEINETNYRHYTKIRNIPMNLFSISSQGKSAQDALDSLLYNHSYCIESITLQAIPIYYLEPNTRILVYDDMSKINGEYLVSKISLPLSYNGMMSINATKAPTRLY